MSLDRCPLNVVEWDWPGFDDDEAKVPMPRPCDAELHLVWSFDIAISDLAEPTRHVGIASKEVADWGITDCWEVVCENGHKLASSSGEESAEPFIMGVVFP